MMSRVCETCFGRGSIQKTVIEADEDGIEWETVKETPCPDCNEGQAPYDPEKDGDYDI